MASYLHLQDRVVLNSFLEVILALNLVILEKLGRIRKQLCREFYFSIQKKRASTDRELLLSFKVLLSRVRRLEVEIYPGLYCFAEGTKRSHVCRGLSKPAGPLWKDASAFKRCQSVV